jgi:hypothetical protein
MPAVVRKYQHHNEVQSYLKACEYWIKTGSQAGAVVRHKGLGVQARVGVSDTDPCSASLALDKKSGTMF